MTKYLLLFFVFTSTFAAVEDQVIIKGKIGSVFDENRVKVTDSLNQSYFLPKRLFPKKFVFKQGNTFTLEVPEKELDAIKVKKL